MRIYCEKINENKADSKRVQKHRKLVQKHRHVQKQKIFRSTNKGNKQAKWCANKA